MSHSQYPGFRGLSFEEAFADESDFVPSRPTEHDAFDMLTKRPPEFFKEFCHPSGEEHDHAQGVSIQPDS